MPEQPLRALPPLRSETTPAAPGPAPRRVVLVLAALLGLALLALLGSAWHASRLASEVAGLEAEVAALRGAVRAQERVIAAQGTRLDAVRGRVRGLAELLDEPLEEAPSAP